MFRCRGCGTVTRCRVQDVLMPIAHAYRPELVLVSAGFDAHTSDPAGANASDHPGFGQLCGAVKEVADGHAGGRLAWIGVGTTGRHRGQRARMRGGALLAPSPSRGTRCHRRRPALRTVLELHRAVWRSALA